MMVSIDWKRYMRGKNSILPITLGFEETDEFYEAYFYAGILVRETFLSCAFNLGV